MLKYILGFINCFILLLASVQAQYIYPDLDYLKKEDFEEIRTRKLIVELKEMDPKRQQKLEKKDPDKLAEELEFIDYYNNLVKHVLPRYWKVNTDISFKSVSEIAEIKSNEYIVFTSEYGQSSFTISTGASFKNKVLSFRLKKPEEADYFFTVMLPSEQISISDFIFVMQQFNNVAEDIIQDNKDQFFNNFRVGQINFRNSKIVKNRTLLFYKPTLDIKLKRLDRKYTYPYQIVDSMDIIEDIIQRADSNYAYIASLFIPGYYGNCYVVVDAGSGRILTVIPADNFTFYVGIKPTKSAAQRQGVAGSWEEYDRKGRMTGFATFKSEIKIRPLHIRNIKMYINSRYVW